MKNNSKTNNFVLVLSFANFFDTGVIVASGLAMPFWLLAYEINGFGIGLLGALGANCFGAAIGALLGGIASDKIGRKLCYNIGLLILLLGCLTCMFSLNYSWLLFGISCMGISIGICVPVSWTYLSELSESEDRSSNLGLSQIARPVAIVSMYVLYFIFSLVIPANDENGNLLPAGTYGPFDGLLSARLFFFILSIVAIYALYSTRKTRESSYWTNKKSQKIPWKKVFVNKKIILSIIFLIGVYATWNIVAGTVAQFMPTIAKVAGVEGVRLAIISFIVCLFSLISVFVFPKLVRKHKHKPLFIFGAFTGILSMFALFMFLLQYMFCDSNYEFFIFIFAILWGSQTGFSAQCFYSIWSSELFPTKVRGSIQGLTFFIIRGISGFWSLFAFGILDATTDSGASYTILSMIILLVITLIVGIIGCPNTQNKSLNEIEQKEFSEFII